ncbi:MAG: AAA family ATPase [Planctomycetales bacterium]|nr:AAA family ATPase [Planctomycetales bacterium]
MAILHLDALPPKTTKGTIVRLLEQVGGLDRGRVGTIQNHGRAATVEVPDRSIDKLVSALDGTPLGTQHIRAWRETAAASTGREDHFQRLIRLLEMEADAEAARALQSIHRLTPAEAEQTGTSLVDLTIRDSDAGLGGRVLITLGKRDTNRLLPWTRLGVGSPVLLSEQESQDGEGWRAIVCGRSSDSVQLALERWPEPQGSRPVFRIDSASDEVARHRQRQALQRAAAAGGDRLSQLRGFLLGTKRPHIPEAEPVEPLNTGLNQSQCEAVAFAMAAEDMAIIHGPPGTGKTTTVVELIRQLVRKGRTVLACAPSNLAVDNVFERLLARGERAVRLGHPARVLPELRNHTLDLIVDAHPDVRLARKLVRDAAALRDKASRYTRAKPEPGARREMYDEARRLMDDARRIEAQVVRHILDTTPIICGTLTGLDSEVLGQRRFDVAVIDEACQSPEPSCWIPLLRCDRVVLAGDHCQLPPTVVSTDAAREGYGVSLPERLLELHGRSISRRLTVQYRMHEDVMTFSSDEFYDGSLVADESVRTHCLAELPGVQLTDRTASPLEFIDTAGASYDEQLEPDGESRLNPSEADLVVRVVESLVETGLASSEIAVIAPYAAQVRLLRSRLPIAGLEVDTVDGFQGREKEAVVISLVRSNPNGDIGFLADVRRMNVALTRARRKLIVIGDSATIGGHSFYGRLLKYFEDRQAYRTVWEEADWS